MTIIFLAGDVMTGRAIDQLLPYPGDPTLRESVVSDARTYISLAEQVNGPIPAPIDFTWPWGEALDIVDQAAPDVRLLNLETTITAGADFARDKAVHYRMHPDNIGCLAAIRPDVYALANNHVLDFGYRGLADTLQTLAAAGIPSAGAGLDVDAAERVAVVGPVVIACCGMGTSGIPHGWAAARHRPGVAYVRDMSDRSADRIADRVVPMKGPGGIAVVSVHWGSNWGYDVIDAQIRFAHRLIDAGIDLVHGHSSHHPRPIEVYRGKLIMYGCGDTIDDYEGISTYKSFRHELRLLYFVSMEGESIAQLRMVPMRMRRMRLERAPEDDAEWLRATLTDISERFGTRVERASDGALTIDAP
jgi:poly-gamma-glutamate capsule biosynthesis protein CapA/YwtB (metallophosphatase superfamily)